MVKFSTTIALAFLITPAVFAESGPDAGEAPSTSTFLAKVTGPDAANRRLVMDNGLIRREWVAGPNLACVSLRNLVTGEEIIRAVEPEASVTIDGAVFPVGGLTGQKNRAFLDERWIASLGADPKAFRFAGWEKEPVRTRLDWKQVRPHAPGAVWPPKGVGVRFDFTAPEPVREASVRTPRFVTTFDKPDAGWKEHRSPAHARSSANNEGKPGEIYTPAESACYLERSWSADDREATVTFDTGTDLSDAHAPGLTVVAGDKTFRLAALPGKKVFRLSGSGIQAADSGAFDPAEPVSLRVTRDGAKLVFSARAGDGEWIPAGAAALPNGVAPGAVRIGKTDADGGASDSGAPGDLVRLKLRAFVFSGEEKRRDAVADATGVRISVHYEIYDGLPLMAKWIEVGNTRNAAVTVDRATTEILAAVEKDASVDNREGDSPSVPESLYIETDYAFGGMTGSQANNSVVRWRADPAYGTQVNYELAALCRLEVTPKRGPAIVLEPGKSWTSWNTFELAQNGDGREREGLAKRRMYRTLAPWATENPLMMHVVSSNPDVVKRAIDQAVECGFEMVILSFGSGLNMEDASPANIAKFKALAAYAKSKHIELGGYSLLASRSVGGGNDVVSPKGTKPAFGNSPALASPWGQKYFAAIRTFVDGSGFSLFEHDGSYPGDWDDAARPPLQRGLDDSQRVQWEMITGLYRELRAKGVFLNVPDWYFLTGSNKTGMGYRETNWSLPREQQLIHTRQNIYDGTWEKTPSMGWMFVPLTQYHGGGAAATIEPLDTHIDHYERMIFSNLALGVQACYRGQRLYDTPRVRDMVSGWTAWYKAHREILESDLIHGRRADGRDIDWMVHVNPVAAERAMLCVFNPLDTPVTRKLRVPLREAGLRGTNVSAFAGVMKDAPGPARKVSVDVDGVAEVEVAVPAGGLAWVIFK